jgi:hypothetical protein
LSTEILNKEKFLVFCVGLLLQAFEHIVWQAMCMPLKSAKWAWKMRRLEQFSNSPLIT